MRPDLTSFQTITLRHPPGLISPDVCGVLCGNFARPPHAQAEVSPPRAQCSSECLLPPGHPVNVIYYNYNDTCLAPVRCPLSFMWSSTHFQCLLPHFLVGCLLTICKEREEAAGSCLWDLNPKRSGVVSTSRVLFWLWLETIVLEFHSREKENKVLPPPYRFDPVRRIGYCPLVRCLGRCLKLERD